MTRVSNRRRYLRHSSLDGLGRDRLDHLKEDIAAYGGAPGLSVQTVTFTNLTNAVNLTAHGYVAGDGPFVLINSGGAMPTEFEAATLYWIGGTVNLNDFQLTDKDGNVITFATDGTGTTSLCQITEDPV